MARFGEINAQYFDDAGDPLGSGKLYFYESGTTTAKTTYADINLTIPNTNPVILTAAGRQPNIFFNGNAKGILTDKNDVQILVRDPIGETGTNFGDAWVATTIYSANSVVIGSDGVYYRSLANGNQNNNPTTTSGFWTLLYSVEWNAGITYDVGAVVTYDNYQYQSLQASNLNQNPETQTAYWVSLAFAWLSTATYAEDQNVVGTDGILYTSLQNSNTGNDPATSASYWVGTSAAAAASAVAAAASATAAAASEVAAETAETNAETAQAAAEAAQAAAETAEVNAETAETNSAASAASSATSASESAASAAAALVSENAAATSESNSASSATASAASAAAALVSENASAASEAAAATSESNAAASASSSATSATASASSATASASSATDSANSATAASGSATAASGSATAAAGSATAASASATSAATSATAAAASLDEFTDLYLGAKSSAPTVDNDGNPLQAGALYFNTVSDTMFVYSGSSWAAAGSAVNGTAERQEYVATSGQTTFSATYDVGFVDVYLNGSKLIPTTDFTASNGATIVLTTGAVTGDNVSIIAYGAFNVADVYTQAQSDARYAQIANVYDKTDSDARYAQQSNNLSDLDSAATALTNLGLTATATELNYTDGVTSNIQTQIDNIDALPSQSGQSGNYLTTDGTNASWSAIETGTTTATASGALTDGCPVVVNSNGTVSKTYRAQQTEATGSQTTISNITMSGVANEVPMVYVPDTEDLFFAITKSSSEEIFLRRVSVTGTTISGGPSTQLTPSGTEGRYQQMAYIGSSKIAIVYRAQNDGGAGRVVIATVAEDGTATFGTELEFVSDSNAMSVSYDSDNDKILITYRADSDGDKGKVVIGTVTGTTVTLGTPVEIPNSRRMGTKYEVKSIYIPEQELLVIAHRGSGTYADNLYLQSYSNNGTTLTHIDEVRVGDQKAEYFDLSYAPDKEMLMVAWSDQDDSDNGKAKNYSFTNIKTFNAIDFHEWEGGAVNGVNINYDPNAQFWYLTYWNLNQSGYPYRRYLKVNGSGNISTDNESVLTSQNTNKVGMAYHAAEFSHVMFFTEWGIAHKIGYDVTNLTSTNYIGISDAGYADGAAAKVQIIGAVDDAQSGLTAGTKAYVQRNGTIGTSADSPSVVAGTAISATDIIVKG